MSKVRSLSLTSRIMVGMVLGVIVGFIFQAILAGEDDFLIPLGLFSLPIKAFFVDGIFHVGILDGFLDGSDQGSVPGP